MQEFKPPTFPLTAEKFQDALRNGLGRVVLQVQRHGEGEFREAIANACTHCLAWDPQCEGSRKVWLADIIDATGQESNYQEAVLAALPTAVEFHDVNQMLDLAVVFARRGDERFREALYLSFEREDFQERAGDTQIIWLDGLEGLLRVASLVGDRDSTSQKGWPESHSFWLVDLCCDDYGRETVFRALEERAAVDAGVRTYLEGLRQSEAEEAARKRGEAETLAPWSITLDQILQDAEAAKGEYPAQYMGFARKAGTMDLEIVLNHLLAEERPEPLLRYLWVFRRAEMPRLETKLFDLAWSRDDRLQDAAINALARWSDPRVRDLLMQLVNQRPESVRNSLVQLFALNYEDGDHQIIESLLTIPQSPEGFHGVGSDLLDVVREQDDPQLTRSLLWLYENNPCSHCRNSALDHLVKWRTAPQWLWEECLWDSYEESRGVAAKVLTS